MEMIANRQKFNKELITILNDAVEHNPEMRFIQLLWALRLIDRNIDGILDRFYEESEATYNRIRKGMDN